MSDIRYCWALSDSDPFQGECATREEAIEEALEAAMDDPDFDGPTVTVWTGEADEILGGGDGAQVGEAAPARWLTPAHCAAIVHQPLDTEAAPNPAAPGAGQDGDPTMSTHTITLTDAEVRLVRRAIMAYTAATDDGELPNLSDTDRAAAKGVMDATEEANNAMMALDPFWAQFAK